MTLVWQGAGQGAIPTSGCPPHVWVPSPCWGAPSPCGGAPSPCRSATPTSGCCPYIEVPSPHRGAVPSSGCHPHVGVPSPHRALSPGGDTVPAVLGHRPPLGTRPCVGTLSCGPRGGVPRTVRHCPQVLGTLPVVGALSQCQGAVPTGTLFPGCWGTDPAWGTVPSRTSAQVPPGRSPGHWGPVPSHRALSLGDRNAVWGHQHLVPRSLGCCPCSGLSP